MGYSSTFSADFGSPKILYFLLRASGKHKSAVAIVECEWKPWKQSVYW